MANDSILIPSNSSNFCPTSENRIIKTPQKRTIANGLKPDDFRLMLMITGTDPRMSITTNRVTEIERIFIRENIYKILRIRKENEIRFSSNSIEPNRTTSPPLEPGSIVWYGSVYKHAANLH